MVKRRGGKKGEGVVGDVRRACFAQGVDEVSGVSGSVAEGGKVSSNGSWPVWALGFGVEDGRGRFERESKEGCCVRSGENESELFCQKGKWCEGGGGGRRVKMVSEG